MNIVTVTVNPALDKNTVVDKVLPTKKLRCEKPSYEAGGGGLNVSRALKEMGQDSLAIFLGGGPTGNHIEQLLKADDIKHKMINTERWTRENLMVMESTTNQEYRFVMPGLQVSKKEWEACLNELKMFEPTPEFIVASGSLPEGISDDFYARIAKIAEDKKSKLIIDTSGPALLKVADIGAFLIKPNLRELSELVGKKTISATDQEHYAREIVNSGTCDILVVSLGARGAMMATKDEIHYVVPPTVKQHSTVGAGDSMVAGLVYALSSGMTYEDMLTLGVAAGTAATMTSGAELCHKEDVFEIFEWMKSKTHSTFIKDPHFGKE